ncbi:hypothetical protein MRX96_055679 [Rhipicephalus microplus]
MPQSWTHPAERARRKTSQVCLRAGTLSGLTHDAIHVNARSSVSGRQGQQELCRTSARVRRTWGPRGVLFLRALDGSRLRGQSKYHKSRHRSTPQTSSDEPHRNGPSSFEGSCQPEYLRWCVPAIAGGTIVSHPVVTRRGLLASWQSARHRMYTTIPR